MPSPFPGMDPYIEDPEIWNDFHSDLAAEMRADLNRQIQPRYVARIIPRVTYELVGIDERRSVRPDVGVWQPAQPSREIAPVATLILVLVTLCGALPVYSQVAARSYVGQGSIAIKSAEQGTGLGLPITRGGEGSGWAQLVLERLAPFTVSAP